MKHSDESMDVYDGMVLHIAWIPLMYTIQVCYVQKKPL